MNLQLCEPTTPAEAVEMKDRQAERKLDGVRAYTQDGRLHTRNGRDVTESFPEINPPEHHVLDGEIITGNFDFGTVLRRVQTERSFKVEMLAERYPARLVAFDAPVVNGGSIREKPLSERQDRLEASIPSGAGIVPITVHDDIAALWRQARAEEWEGIVVKDPTAPYSGGRSDAWLKVKAWEETVAPIRDYGVTDNGGFVIHVETPGGENQKVVVNGRDDQARVQDGADAAEIQYLEQTDDGRFRKPSFKGVA